MASARLRMCFFTSIGLLAAALAYIVPIAARYDSYNVAYHAVHVEKASYPALDLSLATDRVAVTHAENAAPLLPLNEPAKRAIGPVYALSLKTDGHSLADFHRRC